MIDCPLTTDERVSLITAIFSDRNEIDVVKRLRGDDAQSFVDVMDEVLPLSFISEERAHRAELKLSRPAGRCWIPWRLRSGASV